MSDLAQDGQKISSGKKNFFRRLFRDTQSRCDEDQAYSTLDAGQKNVIAYRRDIDGLRAVAVLMVLIFHGGLTFLPSGFIGVDIFFVISGYLTTAVIVRAMDERRFSFSQFYTRRIWRLQPAILALLCMTLVIALVFYLPDEFIDYLKSLKYTSLLISNQYFERTTTGYASADSAQLLLLHTWSLAIEWQWYLAMPVVVVLLKRFCSPVGLRVFSTLCLVIMMIVALYLSDKAPNKSYYFFTSRAFELMVGAWVVLSGFERFKPSAIVSSLLGLAALVSIVFVATRKDILLGFPDYHAVTVCVATALLLSSGISAKGLLSKLLGIAPLVSVGIVSYSLYLWHWPVLATIKYLGIAESTGLTVGYFVISFMLAYLSYKLIENRYRKSHTGLIKPIIFLMVIPAILCTTLYSVAVSHKGWPSRFGAELPRILDTLEHAELDGRKHCLDGAADGSDARCEFGVLGAPSRALLIGDSFSNQYWGFVNVLAKDSELSVTGQSGSVCLALPNTYLFDWWKFKGSVYQECHDWVVNYYDLIRTKHYKYVLLAQIWESYAGDHIVTQATDVRSIELSRQRIEASFREALGIIIQSGATPVVIKAVAPMPADVNECLSRRIKFRDMMGSPEDSSKCASMMWAEDPKTWFEPLFIKLKQEFPSLIVIDPKDVQCAEGSCLAAIDGVPVYRDIGHITDFASTQLGELYIKRYGNPLGHPGQSE